MPTFRRCLMDKFLISNRHLMTGRVLDVGGKRVNSRGQFSPPTDKVREWIYLNPDQDVSPDICGTAEKIPVETGSFQTVMCCEVMEYLEDIQQSLKEMHRVLDSSGLLIATVPFLISVHGDDNIDRQRFTRLKLQEVIEGAGFQSVAIEPMGALWAVIHDLMHVSLGYAAINEDDFVTRIKRKLLNWSRPFLWWLDKRSLHVNRYITTGYGVVARKTNA